LTAVLGSDFVEEKWSAVASVLVAIVIEWDSRNGAGMHRKAVEIDGGESSISVWAGVTQNLKDF
jgi:hypothetical protein